MTLLVAAAVLAFGLSAAGADDKAETVTSRVEAALCASRHMTIAR